MKKIACLLMAALALLTACTTEAERQHYAALIAEADSMNRHYIPFTTDTVLQDAVRFYDRHGSANQRMQAYYLLGCAYRDLGEAPQALTAYQQAVNCVERQRVGDQRSGMRQQVGDETSGMRQRVGDQRSGITTASDCNYQVLMAVYGQMAELYDAQNLPKDEIEVTKKYQHYALLTKDTLKYIRNIQLMVKPYYLLGDTNKVLEVLNTARKLYLKYGFRQEAAGIYATPIFIMTQRGQLEEARRMINVFEHESGLFDEEGNICKSREGYYYTRGLFCMAVNELDSAERYMRKLLSQEYEVDAYRGLLQVYRRRNNADSIAKFSLLYETALDTLHNQTRTETIHRMTAMYDYQRFQNLATKKETEARTMGMAFAFSVFALLCVLLTLFTFVWAYRQNKLHKLQKLMSNLAKTTEDYHYAQQELEQLSSKNDKEQKEKQKEVAQLKTQLSQYMSQLQTIKPTTRITPDNMVLKKFKAKTFYKGTSGIATDGNWRELTELFVSALPRTYAFIACEGVLSPLELRTCMLTYFNFPSGDIATLLATSPQTITNGKSSANQKLFHDSSAATLLKNMKFYAMKNDKV